MSKLCTVPLVCADMVPDDLLEYFLDKDYSTHCSHDVVSVDLEDGNPLATWLIAEGHKFTKQEQFDGWAWVAIMGS